MSYFSDMLPKSEKRKEKKIKENKKLKSVNGIKGCRCSVITIF